MPAAIDNRAAVRAELRKKRTRPDGSKYTKPSIGDRKRNTRRTRTGGRSLKGTHS